MRLRRLFPVIAVTLILALSILPLSATARRAADPEAKPGAGDTPVYVLNGSKPGPTVLILGGTHGDEIAGAMTALLIVERARVECGRLIVVPRANNSASTNTLPGWPRFIELETPSGTRAFRYGSRLTHPQDEAADPSTFVHYPSGTKYPGEESRNLNRCHPGKADGNLTQKIAFAFWQLILKEKPAIAVDFHEGPVDGAYMAFIHYKCLNIGLLAQDGMVEQGLSMGLDQFEWTVGTGDIEWGEGTPTFPFTTETGNPGVYEPISADAIVNDPAHPLWYRVGYHITAMQSIIKAYGVKKSAVMTVTGLPSMADLKSNGLGAYFN